MRKAIILTAILLLIVGLIWFFQGIGVLPGSFMTGQVRWAEYGGILAAFAIGLLLAVNRRVRKDKE